jgi:hypothetical protein
VKASSQDAARQKLRAQRARRVGFGLRDAAREVLETSSPTQIARGKLVATQCLAEAARR